MFERDMIFKELNRGVPAIFLDYDGTLSPIVDRPEDAVIPERTREIVRKLSEKWTVAVVSGRDLNDVRGMVGLENIVYAGSHGFDIAGPEGEIENEGRGTDFLPSLDEAEKELEKAVSGIEGARVERKKFSIALHYRACDRKDVPALEKRFDDVLEKHPDLEKSAGKKIFELRPKTDWDKGQALLFLMDRLHIDRSKIIPVYIGDDTTDEDAFRVLKEDGIGILVSDRQRETEADFILHDTQEAADFLERMYEEVGEGAPGGLWALTYEGYDPEQEQLRECLCMTGNGYFATRGAAPESSAGEHHYPGTYFAGCYNRRTSNVKGRDIENESMVNTPNWLPLKVSVEGGGWFEVDGADILEYRQELDIRNAVLERLVRFRDGEGRITKIRQRRFVSMDNRHIAALETTVAAENWSGRIRVHSGIDGGVENTLVRRYRDLDNHHLEQVDRGFTGEDMLWLQAETNQSRICFAVAVRTRVFLGNRSFDIERERIEKEDYVAHEFEVEIEEGGEARIEKVASLFSSRDRAISESLIEARDLAARTGGFAELLDDHVRRWSHLWERCHISGQADSERTMQILNLHIYHLLVTVSTHTIGLDCGVPPRGIHGEAYRGLIMWDELFIFPFLNFRILDLTRALLQYRYRRMERARWAASEEGYEGAMFPWQSGSNGREEAQTLHLNPESGRWIPDNSHLQRHINIAVAYNVWQYYQVTGDIDFLSFYGSRMIVEIARFWSSKIEFDESRKRYVIRKVMGPDEFHDSYPDREEAGIDNNAYTNVMAVWVLCRALDILWTLPPDRLKSTWENLSLKDDEIDRWEDICSRMYVPFHDEGIISQFEGYEDLEEFDWEGYRKKYGDIERLDRILEAEGDTPNRYKLSKQADVLMLFYLLSPTELYELFERLGYELDRDMLARNIDYYMDRTSHGSTLSRLVHSWVLSRYKRELSWHLFRDALESDVSDIQGGTTHEGIHLGAMAGTVDLIQRCYTGLETREDVLRFDPQLPEVLRSLDFNIRYRGHLLYVVLTREMLTIRSRAQKGVPPVMVGFRDSVHELATGHRLEFDLESAEVQESKTTGED